MCSWKSFSSWLSRNFAYQLGHRNSQWNIYSRQKLLHDRPHVQPSILNVQLWGHIRGNLKLFCLGHSWWQHILSGGAIYWFPVSWHGQAITYDCTVISCNLYPEEKNRKRSKKHLGPVLECSLGTPQLMKKNFQSGKLRRREFWLDIFTKLTVFVSATG